MVERPLTTEPALLAAHVCKAGALFGVAEGELDSNGAGVASGGGAAEPNGQATPEGGPKFDLADFVFAPGASLYPHDTITPHTITPSHPHTSITPSHHHTPNLPLVVKRAKSGQSGGLSRAELEVKLLKAVSHPHLLPLLGYCLSPDGVCHLSPLMRGGSLEARLRLSDPDRAARSGGWGWRRRRGR